MNKIKPPLKTPDLLCGCGWQSGQIAAAGVRRAVRWARIENRTEFL